MTISNEHRTKISKKVKIGKTIFASLGEAAEHFGVCRETINRAVKKNNFRGMSARIVE
jgi:IS30 family transposase